MNIAERLRRCAIHNEFADRLRLCALRARKMRNVFLALCAPVMTLPAAPGFARSTHNNCGAFQSLRAPMMKLPAVSGSVHSTARPNKIEFSKQRAVLRPGLTAAP